MVLEDGAAKEIGTHAELMKLDGIYRNMFEKQQLEAAGQPQPDDISDDGTLPGGTRA